MPFIDIVGQGLAAVALDRIADDDADGVGGLLQRRLQGFQVVAVHFDDVAAERGEALGRVRDRQAAALRAVVVIEHGEIGELEVARDHDRFPDRTFVRFAVADQRVDLARLAGDARTQRHADGEANAVAERTGRSLGARHLGAVGVAAEGRVELAEGVDFLEGKVAVAGERAIEAERGVALAQHEHVAVGRIRLLRIVTHGLVHRRHHLDDREGCRDVAVTALVRDVENLGADLLADRVHFDRRSHYNTT